MFAPLNRSLQIVEEHDSITSLIAAVESGRGVAVIAQPLNGLASPRLKIRPSTSAPTARGWDRLSQEIPLKDNGQLYRGRQARESGLTGNFPLGRRDLLMGRSAFHE